MLVSSGAIAAGLAPLRLHRAAPGSRHRSRRRPASGQLRLVQTYADAFAAHDITVGQVLLTADDLTRRSPLPQRPADGRPAARRWACCRS